jgi:hypothetical protein
MLTEEMFAGSIFPSFIAVEYSRYDEYDPETETVTRRFKLVKVLKEEFDQFEYIGEGTMKGIPRIQKKG